MAKFNTVNPSSGELLAEYDIATPDEIKEAITRARKAFQSWRRLQPSDRGKYFTNTAGILRERKQDFGKDMSNEMGKIIRESIAEVEKCALVLEYYAENAEHFLVPEPAQTDAAKSFVAFDPIGVVAAIMLELPHAATGSIRITITIRGQYCRLQTLKRHNEEWHKFRIGLQRSRTPYWSIQDLNRGLENRRPNDR